MSIYTAQNLGQKLLQKGLLTQEQLDKFSKEQIENGYDFETLVRGDSSIPAIEIVKAKGEILGIPYTNPLELQIDPEALKSVGEQIARKYRLIPVKKNENEMVVVMEDPNDLEAIEFLQQSTGVNIKLNIGVGEEIKQALDREYSKSLGQDVNIAIEQAAESTTAKLQENLKSIEQAEDLIKVSPVAQIVSVILEYAVKAGASDLHIEPFETGTRIRYRIDGVLQEKFPLPKTIHNSVVARIKILSNMQIDEHRKPLDGKFKVVFGERKTDLRVSSLPTVFGEKIVIRLLKDQKDTFTLKELGLWGRSRTLFDKSLKESTGIILVTGPTGSGKTVTNATALSKLNSNKVNIITLEDPVEIQIEGVNQVQINPVAGLTFASGLRAILRQDPDVIMVGEIRDKETAQLAIQAALTGHLVLATLHTNSAAGAIPRLIDMGVENFLLGSTLKISLAQRLVRKVCKYCKESYTPDEEVIKDIKKILPDNLLQLGTSKSPYDESFEAQEKGGINTHEIKAEMLTRFNDSSGVNFADANTNNNQQAGTNTNAPNTNNSINANQVDITMSQASQSAQTSNNQTSNIQNLNATANNNQNTDQNIQNGEIILYRGKGCDKCGGTGYKGRIAIYEVMDMSEEVMKLTLRNSSSEEIQKAAQNSGMITLLQDGYLKSMWGITTLEEVLSAADE